MGFKRVQVKVTLGEYKVVKLSIDDSIKLINSLKGVLGYRANDLEEAERIINNYDVFIQVLERKFRNYILIPHKIEDTIRGRIVVDKISFKTENDEIKAIIIFDKRFDIKFLEEALKNIGYEIEVVREE